MMVTLALKSTARQRGNAHRAPGSPNRNSQILRRDEETLLMAVRLLDRSQYAAVPPDVLSDDTRVPIALIDSSPHNPRHALVDVDALADSIEQYSLLQPVVVRRIGARYQLIGGHRRVAAFRLLGARRPQDCRWTTIPAVVRGADAETADLMSIASQVHSARWTPREEAAVLERLAETRTLKEIGALVHKSDAWVSARLRIYADAVLSAHVQMGNLSAGVAQELLLVKNADQRQTLAARASADNWNVGQARDEVRALRGRPSHNLAQLLSALEDAAFWLEPATLTAELRMRLVALHRRIDEALQGSAA